MTVIAWHPQEWENSSKQFLYRAAETSIIGGLISSRNVTQMPDTKENFTKGINIFLKEINAHNNALHI